MNSRNKATPHQYASRTVLCFLTVMLGLSLVNELFIKPHGLFAYLVIALVEVVSVVLTLLVYTRSNKINPRTFFRFNPIDRDTAFVMVLIGLCAQGLGILVNMPMVLIVSHFGEIPTNDLLMPTSVSQLLVGVVCIAFIPAVFEEVLARGILFREYENYGAKAAIIGSALYFGVMHNDFIKLPFTIFLGIVLAIVVLRTNSLFAAMIVHFVNNLMALIQSYILQRFDLQTNVAYGVFMFGLYIVLAMGFLMVFIRFLKDTKPNVGPAQQELRRPYRFSLSMAGVLLLFFVFAALQIVQILNIDIGGLYL